MSIKNEIYLGNLETEKAITDKLKKYSMSMLMSMRFDTKVCHSDYNNRLLRRLYDFVFSSYCNYTEEDKLTIREEVLKISILDYEL